jgi:hypothetical protein
MGIAMMGFLHGYLKFTQPLFIQALMGLKNLYDAKPVALHLLGKPAEGDLKRPFKSPPGMFGSQYSFLFIVPYLPLIARVFSSSFLVSCAA